MRYIVCNVLSEGVRSVGTRELDFEEAVESVRIRTGQPPSRITEAIEQLHPQLAPSVTIPADTRIHCAARIEVVR